MLYRAFAVLLILFLVACEPVDVEQTATSPTPVLDVTPTQEILDCTGRPYGEFSPVNFNPCLDGFTIERLAPDDDGVIRRYQAVPDEWFGIINRGDRGVPPFINEQNDTRYQFEISFINGEFGYGQDDIILNDHCYIAKFTGYAAYTDVSRNNTNLTVGINVRNDTVRLAPQPPVDSEDNDYNGYFERIFPFQISQSVVADVYFLVTIRWATPEGFIVVDNLEVLEAPDGYCSGLQPIF